MTDEKICPFMSIGQMQPDGDHLLATIYCQRERCMAWVLEQSSYWACTLNLEDMKPGDCKLHYLVEMPEDVPQEATCEGCQHFKEIKCKPIPAHCRLIERGA